MVRIGLFILLYLSAFLSYGQFDAYIKKANEYRKAGLFNEARVEMELARKIAKKENREEDYLSATLDLTDLYRQLGDYDKAITLLKSIYPSKYPKLLVSYYARYAAIHHEYSPYTSSQQLQDSVLYYSNKALAIAKKHGFEEYIALLNTEIGFLKFRHRTSPKGADTAEVCYILACNIYQKYPKQLENYLNTLNHLLEIKIFKENWLAADSLRVIIDSIYLNDTNQFYWQKFRTYGFYALYANLKGDTCTQHFWDIKTLQAIREYDGKRSNQDIAAFRVMYDTNLLQADLDKTKQTFWYGIFLLGLIISFLIIYVYLFLQERKQKNSKEKLVTELSELNNQYQLLMKESNHRIKNNLLMIVSFLQITSLQADEKEKKLLSKVQSKMEAISALHKLLRFDNHNEKVSVKKYMLEIIGYFQDLDKEDTVFNLEVDDFDIVSEDLIYLGLIITELILNTLEHRENKEYPIEISLKKAKEEIVFEYKDYSKYKHTKENMGITLLKEMIRRIKGEDIHLDKTSGILRFKIYAKD